MSQVPPVCPLCFSRGLVHAPGCPSEKGDRLSTLDAASLRLLAEINAGTVASLQGEVAQLRTELQAAHDRLAEIARLAAPAPKSDNRVEISLDAEFMLCLGIRSMHSKRLAKLPADSAEGLALRGVFAGGAMLLTHARRVISCEDTEQDIVDAIDYIVGHAAPPLV